MRFLATPRYNLKAKQKMHKRALETMKMSRFDIGKEEGVEKIRSLNEYLQNAPGTPESLEEGMYLSDIASAYAYLLAEVIDWKTGEVAFKEQRHNDFFAIVSLGNEYAIYSMSLILRAFLSKKDLMVDLYEKIKNGQLPPSEPDKFLDLVKYFYEDKNKEKFIPFDPLEKEDREEWFSFAQKGAEIFNVPLDSENKPIPSDVKEIISRIELEILARKPKFDEFEEEDYLKSLSSLYGQCLKAATNWELAITWMETDEGIEGMPVLHSPDKRYWISPYATIYRELTSKRKTSRLLQFYRILARGNLPVVETELPEEIK